MSPFLRFLSFFSPVPGSDKTLPQSFGIKTFIHDPPQGGLLASAVSISVGVWGMSGGVLRCVFFGFILPLSISLFLALFLASSFPFLNELGDGILNGHVMWSKGRVVEWSDGRMGGG